MIKNKKISEDFLSKIKSNPDLLLNTFILYDNGVIDYVFKIYYAKSSKDINFVYYIAYSNQDYYSIQKIPITSLFLNKNYTFINKYD